MPEAITATLGADADINAPATDTKTLTQMQDNLFKKVPAAPTPTRPRPKNEPEPEPSPTGRDRAQEIFEQASKHKVIEPGEPEPETKDLQPSEEDFPFADLDAQVPTPKKKEPEPEDTELDSEEPEVDISRENNLKNLRQIAGQFKKERDSLKQQIEELNTKQRVTVDAKTLKQENFQLRERVKNLEQWELVYNLENSPVFKQQFSAPLNDITAEVRQIVTDYGLDESAADEILAVGNRKDLDEILEDTFSSQSVRGDIKNLKQKYDGILRKKAELLKKPKEALEALEQERATFEADRREKRQSYLKQTSQAGWEKALIINDSLPREEKIWELVEVPGKKDHNEKVVVPALTTANNHLNVALSYIEKLVQNQGVMSEPFVQWLASTFQQAAATRMVNKARWDYYKALEQARGKDKKATEVNHPRVSAASRTSPPKPSKPDKKDGRGRAADIFNEVMEELGN